MEKSNNFDRKFQRITIDVEENALEIIDKAAKNEFCSRTSFLVRNGVKAAKQLEEA